MQERDGVSDGRRQSMKYHRKKVRLNLYAVLQHPISYRECSHIIIMQESDRGSYKGKKEQWKITDQEVAKIPVIVTLNYRIQ